MQIALATIAKPWSCEARQRCDVLVDTVTGEVLVYDEFANHYTQCHSLTFETERLVKRARKIEDLQREKPCE